MYDLPADLLDFAEALRAELRSLGPIEEILLDTVVIAAIRLKVLHRDPRAFDPFDQTWTRAHTTALRAFFRAHDTLTRRRRPGSRTTAPPPGVIEPSRQHIIRSTTSEPRVASPSTLAPALSPAEASPPDGPSPPTELQTPAVQPPETPPAAPPSPNHSNASEPTFDDLLKRPLRRDHRSRKVKLLETHVLRHAVDRIVPVSAIPPRASP